jgi:hypothetical protein
MHYTIEFNEYNEEVETPVNSVILNGVEVVLV